MDGTMFDTEILWKDISNKVAQKYGHEVDDTLRTQMMGKKDKESLGAMKEYFGLSDSIDDLIHTRRKMILDDVRTAGVKEGLFELLNLLDKKGIKKAVATSSFRELTQKFLAQAGIEDRFDAIVCGDDVTIGKPDPMIFLEASRRIGVPPAECLVLEDSQNGVEAGAAAGMTVFAIPHDSSRYQNFRVATRVLKSMKEVDEKCLESL